MKDKIWWYGSLRDQNIKVALPNFPVKAFETGLRNMSAKGTYALSQNNKLTGYAHVAAEVAAEPPGHLPDRRHGRAPQLGRRRRGSSTTGATPTRPATSRCSATARSSRSAAASSGTCGRTTATAKIPAYQDIGNQIVSGGNRDGWFRTPSRNQIAGSMTYYKSGLVGDHNFKVGGEWFRETFTDERGIGVDGSVPGDVLHILNNGVAGRGATSSTRRRCRNRGCARSGCTCRTAGG